MDDKDIGHKLLAADAEDEVQAILDSVPELKNPKNWHPLDNRETNFNVTSNQAATGGKALTELMTNGRCGANEACPAEAHRSEEPEGAADDVRSG